MFIADNITIMGCLSKEKNRIDFDVFFIYKSDRSITEWVTNTCRDLEQMNIICGYYERDFRAGHTIQKNIVQCIKRSKNVVVLISPGFNNSELCTYYLDTALTQKLSSKILRIVPVYKDIKTQDIPESLMAFTGLDVSGEKDEWWDKFVQAVNDSDENPIDSMNYYVRKMGKLVEDYPSQFTPKVKQKAQSLSKEMCEHDIPMQVSSIQDKVEYDLDQRKLKEIIRPIPNGLRTLTITEIDDVFDIECNSVEMSSFKEWSQPKTKSDNRFLQKIRKRRPCSCSCSCQGCENCMSKLCHCCFCMICPCLYICCYLRTR